MFMAVVFLKLRLIWNPEEHPTEGKSIILSLEGGFGDEFIHARYATHLEK
jgi:hypothetical protein